MDQAALTPTDFASAVTAITSAFGDPTRRDIYLFARDAIDGVTATEAAEHFDLHANVARHHLDKLAAGAYLEITVERAPNRGAGRPSKRYRSAGDQAAIELPVRHDDVLIALLGKALAALGPVEAERLAEEVGQDYGRTMSASLGRGDTQRSFRAALHLVAEALTAHGFAARAERKGDELRIVSDHCPFGESAIEHPVMCAVDRGMVQGMLEELFGSTATADLASSKSRGDAACVTTVSA